MKTRNKLICLLIAVLASFLLWYYIVTVVSTEMTKTVSHIPVTFSGEDILREQNLIITNGAGSTVSLQLTGRRTVVDPIENTNITITVDVSKIRAAGEYTRGYTISYPNQTSNVTVGRKIPDTVTIRVEDLLTREIPVKTIAEGSVAEGYKLESVKPALSSITVTGTEKQIADISTAVVQVDLQGIDADVTKRLEYTFVDGKGNAVNASDLEVDESALNVTVKVTKFKQVPLFVEFVNGGGAEQANVHCEIEPVSIEVSGSEELLDGLNKLVLENISLSAIEEDKRQLTFPILLPDGLRNESGIVQATAYITISGVVKSNVQTGDIEFINIPTGFVAVPVTQSVAVTVRGPAEEVGRLTAEDLRVVADISGGPAAAGKYTCGSVQVYLEKTGKSGILGKYSVEYELISEEDYLKETVEDEADR